MNNIDHYRGMLHVSKHRLDDELEIQSEYQEQISAQVARLNTRMIQAKDDLARVESRLYLDFKEAEDKLTEATIKAKVQRHSERERAWKLLQEARQEHEEWSGLLDAWVKRGYSIKTLGDLYVGQYFAVRSVGNRESREGVRQAVEGRQERAAQRAEQSAKDAGITPPRPRRRIE